MALFRCKMCGGELNVTNDTTIIKCEYCENTQTVPTGNDEEKSALFNRANDLRMKCEFDKASGIYESIITKYPNESEGYWGLVLCKFGIEYVDDPSTGKKIPTCHRTNPTSVMEDSDFERAYENTDSIAREVYRNEAKAIDKLQQEIISVVEKEEPYDVFICYKETDDGTKEQTEDSRIAQDIYTALLERGYKVFFARQTLKAKAGTEYEPYIYAALNSSKVMLAIGTKYIYYDAVWVKNEWGRFLRMMANDPSKHLIPCFKNLDAYDIPKEFKNLQALDISDTMFSDNLMQNIERFIPKANSEPQKEIVRETVVKEVSGNDSASKIAPLLERGFMALEDGEWNDANNFFEQALNIDAKLASAYLGKLMAQRHVHTEAELANCRYLFDSDNNYAKILRFGDDNLKMRLDGYLQVIKKRLDEEERKRREAVRREEEKKLEEAYQAARSSMRSAQNEDDFLNAAAAFDKLGSFRDSASLAKQCRENIKKLQRAKKLYLEKYPDAEVTKYTTDDMKKMESDFKLANASAIGKMILLSIPLLLSLGIIAYSCSRLIFYHVLNGAPMMDSDYLTLGLSVIALYIGYSSYTSLKAKTFAIKQQKEILKTAQETFERVQTMPTFEEFCKSEGFNF